MHCRIEQANAFRTFDAFDDHGIVAHAAADKAALPGKGRRRTLADDPQLLVAMPFTPCEIVVVVHTFDDRTANDLPHALHDPLAASVRIQPTELHPSEIGATKVAIGVENGRRNIYSIFAAYE